MIGLFELLFIFGLGIGFLVVAGFGIVFFVQAISRRPPSQQQAEPLPEIDQKAILKQLEKGEISKAEAEDLLAKGERPMPPPPAPQKRSVSACIIVIILAIILPILALLAFFGLFTAPRAHKPPRRVISEDGHNLAPGVRTEVEDEIQSQIEEGPDEGGDQ